MSKPSCALCGFEIRGESRPCPMELAGCKVGPRTALVCLWDLGQEDTQLPLVLGRKAHSAAEAGAEAMEAEAGFEAGAWHRDEEQAEAAARTYRNSRTVPCQHVVINIAIDAKQDRPDNETRHHQYPARLSTGVTSGRLDAQSPCGRALVVCLAALGAPLLLARRRRRRRPATAAAAAAVFVIILPPP